MHSQTVSHHLPPTRLKWAYSHLQSDPTKRHLAVSGANIELYKIEILEEEEGLQLKPVHRLVHALPGKKAEGGAPVTNVDWNYVDPAILGSCSIDTTCTIWNIETGQAKTQLIAHDKQVFDMSFSNAQDVFASVGGDGSVRLFDLRNLEHSTILYENQVPMTNQSGTEVAMQSRSLFRVAWNKLDNHFLITFQEDSNKIILLDSRLPSIPVAELIGHSERSSLVDICWSPTSSSHLASLGSDGQVLIWDLLDPELCHLTQPAAAATRSSSQNALGALVGVPPPTSPGTSTTASVRPAYGYNLASQTGCQLVWPSECPEILAATDTQSLHIIPI
jgi:hypothetical protein